MKPGGLQQYGKCPSDRFVVFNHIHQDFLFHYQDLLQPDPKYWLMFAESNGHLDDRIKKTVADFYYTLVLYELRGSRVKR
jgi:hypothetical protein